MDERSTTQSLDPNGDISLFSALEGLGHPCLIAYSGAHAGRRIDLEDGVLVLGRGEGAQVAVDGPGISRRHAEFTVTATRVTLRDLGSSNHSYVNHQPITDAVALKDGDVLRFGHAVFRFHDRRSLDVVLHDRLYELATVDPGTGVFNRRYTQEALRLEFVRARRSGQPLTLITCDLDHFKHVNDSYGHLAGDEVLRTTATLLRNELRAGDVIGRWGGEEFVVLARDTGPEHALGLAERLRSALADQVFTLRADGAAAPSVHRQTLSAGVAWLSPEMHDENDLLAAADRRLYVAKHEGRNRVIAADHG